MITIIVIITVGVYEPEIQATGGYWQGLERDGIPSVCGVDL